LAPVAAAMPDAWASSSARHARPPTKTQAGSPDFNASAISAIAASAGGSACAGARSRPGTPPFDHDTSAGSTSVATWPGGPLATATASAASAPTSSALADHRMNVDTLRATVSMSDSSWASYCLW
jgi:hypothetical protein